MNLFVLFGMSVCGMLFAQDCFAAPAPVSRNDISDSVEDDNEDPPVLEDDITTHGLERLSSAATCLVAGVEYTHGQQIYRSDPCEFCLCLDGEMFCWWQDCPPTMEGPCKDRGPFSACITVPVAPPKPSKSAVLPSSTLATIYPSKTTTSTVRTTSEVSYSTTDYLQDSSTYTEETEVDSETPKDTSTPQQTSVCLVMGREYQVGDKLPHDTGNCLECICGTGAKVTCSPHQCTPAGDEINDYRPPGPRQPMAEVF